MTRGRAIPVIDLFAGPGGLGEGFSSIVGRNGKRRFSEMISPHKHTASSSWCLHGCMGIRSGVALSSRQRFSDVSPGRSGFIGSNGNCP
ncbi:hypothetical protein CVV70_22560 [Ralstonia solanacearum]|nr:hypothetical protein CCY86_00325 [Ralstonia solanacearum]ATJ84847.1 hypothetical protein CDC59_00325 [Ralstonia solanacearum]OPK45890.1 hypothetical protein B5G54_22645 [Ralstonia solanacearum]OPK47953.1 hypothetical protein B5S37_22980 [Ralstonia solanacearum]OPK52710.1 hypothetical protein B5J95_17060 [Ralstonia solanacearum]